MPLDELTCQELVELITEYLEGTLPPRERARFDAHLEGCSACRGYLDQMRRTLRTLGRLREEDLPTPAAAELVGIFRGWKRGRSAG